MKTEMDSETMQKYKDSACRYIQECDEVLSIDCDFGLEDGEPDSGYRTYKYGDRKTTINVIKYKKPESAKWKECTAGEALDAMVRQKAVQVCRGDKRGLWKTIEPYDFRKQDWTDLWSSYRMEVKDGNV